MDRIVFAFAALLAAVGALGAGARAAADDCRKAYVIPYAEQCGYAYGTIKKDRSPGNLSAAFAACGRAQDVAASCVTNSDRALRAASLSALYGDVTRQADIAMFARQFSVAEALLREKLQVLDATAMDGKKGDPSLARARAATDVDLRDARTGACTQRATASAPQQRALAHAHKYGELEALLKTKSQAYGSCVKLASSPARRAYVEYVGLVAIEESGRAAQASGPHNDSAELYAICIAGAKRSAAYAVAPVKAYLQTVAALCAGRANGTYRVDAPEALDADTGTVFKPLSLPKT